MRFSKRVKICKGLSLNLSKSGASLSAGRRGASLNIGSKGAYINAGIPGTGFSARERIGTHSKSSSNKRPSNEGKNHVTVEFMISLDDLGKPIIKDTAGSIIDDESIIRQLRTQESYKEAVRNLINSRKEAIEKVNCDFIEIYKQTPRLRELKSAEDELNLLKFEEYQMEEFSKGKPSLQSIQSQIEAKSRNPINKIFFWKKGEADSDKDPNAVYQKEMDQWQEEKLHFEEQERKKKEHKTASE